MITDLTPNFCFITPIPLLDQFASQSKKHLCLAHLVAKHPETYGAFYKKMRERGDYVIMDNSAFELGASYNPADLVKLGNLCGANAIVLPDYPGQHWEKTVEAASQWIPYFKEEQFDTFFVPQSIKGDLEGWLKAYEFGANNQRVDIIGMSILGIPNALSNIPAAYARVVMTQLLISTNKFNFNKAHHYLGLNAGPNLEVPPLLKMGALWSIDSSGPVWQAILGHQYTKEADSFQMSKKIHFPVDFNHEVKDNETLMRIQNNINMTQELFYDYKSN